MVRKNQKEIKFVKRQDTEHPYCTNWPMNEKEEKIAIHAHTPVEFGGWLEAKLPNSVMKRLQSYIETAKKNPISANWSLAGNISKSLDLVDKDGWFFQTYLAGFISKYHEYWPGFTTDLNILTEDAPFYMNRFWVNFQKETEFNPLHAHSGLWSFVIWVKIPTDWREQHEIPFAKGSHNPKASDFELYYMTMLGNITHTTYQLDKQSEGTMLFFPAKLNHTVYPFYNCDKERVSISGNILLDISEKAMEEYRHKNSLTKIRTETDERIK